MADVKICGITDSEGLDAAIEGGARYVGFMFYPASPRFLEASTAKPLAEGGPKGVRRVGVFVDPTGQDLNGILGEVPLDMIQLHGEESPERVLEIKQQYGLQVMKAIRVATKYDLEELEDYEEAADWLLFDAKPPGADLPGGTGQSFDWKLLTGRGFKKPWMLSGGLTAENVVDAIKLLNPKVVDVSSGVEEEPGQKSPEKIKEFITVVKNNG